MTKNARLHRASSSRPLIIAHRGCAIHAPENTLPAFKAAREGGANGIETDVQLTSDGHAVIHHNASIDDTSNGSGAISRLTFDQVRSYDFGAYRGEAWAGTRIPTLDECLDAVAGMRLVNLELKAYEGYDVCAPEGTIEPLVRAVVDAVHAHGMTGTVIVSSFRHDLLRQVKNLDANMRVGALMTSFDPRDPVAYLQQLDFPVEFLHLHFSVILKDPTVMERMAQAGIGCNAWTVDEPDDIRQMMQRGCNALITNRIDRFERGGAQTDILP